MFLKKDKDSNKNDEANFRIFYVIKDFIHKDKNIKKEIIKGIFTPFIIY